MSKGESELRFEAENALTREQMKDAAVSICLPATFWVNHQNLYLIEGLFLASDNVKRQDFKGSILNR